MTEPSEKPDLKTRVQQFNCLELPGQPRGMHMGTAYLVGDLWREVQRLQALVQATTEPAEASRDHPDDEDDLERLRERAQIIRSAFAGRTGGIDPLEETAECIEWGVKEIERLRALVAASALHEPDNGPDVLGERKE